MEQQQGEAINFDTCSCGESETFIGHLRKKVEEKGLDLEGYPECLSVTHAVMQKPGMGVLTGMKTPAGEVAWDVCMGCGSLRAIRVVISDALALPGPIGTMGS